VQVVVRRERMSIPLLKNLHVLVIISPCWRRWRCFNEFYIDLKPQLLKFPTLLELLDTNIELIFALHPCQKKKDLRWSCKVVGQLTVEHPTISICGAYLFYLPVLNPTDKNHLQDWAYTSKHGSHTCSDALPWSEKSSITYCCELRPRVGVETHNLA
jgi:hypothetical protein